MFQYASFEDKRLVKSLLGQYSAYIGERSAGYFHSGSGIL